MKTIVYIAFWVVLSTVLIGQEIAPPAKRMQILDSARVLLTAKPVGMVSDEIVHKNPFNRIYDSAPVVVREVNAPVPVASVSTGTPDRDILVGSVSEIRPTGSMQLGDTAYLLFGQKKLKVGDILPISFNGESYELSLTAIDSTTFTLRYKSEEITRPIKPAANKP